ncbi:unnamed protein product [Dovyalis caffra]|uniref:Uncharacterized protein n=1 Tax=Dovyalis caffra TaxID=77055 RepID=A0AAV1QWX9_9ROSI|nr:unnamed protein product [Dovyalis caffra]
MFFAELIRKTEEEENKQAIQGTNDIAADTVEGIPNQNLIIVFCGRWKTTWSTPQQATFQQMESVRKNYNPIVGDYSRMTYTFKAGTSPTAPSASNSVKADLGFMGKVLFYGQFLRHRQAYRCSVNLGIMSR